jgi:hypothetical protein
MTKNVFAWLTGFLFLFLFLSMILISGCYKYVAVHPEKSEAQYYEDKKECEEKARDYAMLRVQEYRENDEINRSSRCMRDKGWKYRFRK